MKAVVAFSDILTALSRAWNSRDRDQCFLSLALPIPGIDPLIHLPILANDEEFSFLWDFSSCDSFAAAGQCQLMDLTGPKRFELAQRFSDSIFARLLDITPEAPLEAKPRIMFSFSFFEQISERQKALVNPSVLKAVFPRWQLISNGGISWLRINGVAVTKAEARELAENLWIMSEKLTQSMDIKNLIEVNRVSAVSSRKDWQSSYESVLSRGIDLVNNGVMKKLVLAVCQSITLSKPFNPLAILFKLRNQYKSSCRFLWQNSSQEIFFGASPERLLSLKGASLTSDALAGTSSAKLYNQDLLKSDKDLREHSVVVSSIVQQLLDLDLAPNFARQPKLMQCGKIFHLHTPIFSKVNSQRPLELLNKLHPTPAVAGFPVKDAIDWIRALEPFDRGQYAAPIGWIRSNGDSEFRVAIRCGKMRANNLDLFAGAGLVRGSVKEKELSEVSLKFDVLLDQFEFISSI